MRFVVNIEILNDLDIHKVCDNFIALGRLRKKYPEIPDEEIIEAFEEWHHKEYDTEK